jgi:hypothetical protein
MFCNQHHPNHSDNKLWAGMFQTSLINLFCYTYLLSISFVMNVADIYHPHVVILALWGFDHLSLSYLVILIHVQSVYALVTLQWLLPSTSISSGVIAFCHFWWVIYFSPIKSFSSESRDEILFRGEGCDSQVLVN